MVRIAKALGLVILCVAVLILSLISYVSLRKDSFFSSKYYTGGPRIMFHAGFRWVRLRQTLVAGGVQLTGKYRGAARRAQPSRIRRAVQGPDVETLSQNLVIDPHLRRLSPAPSCEWGFSIFGKWRQACDTHL